MKKRTLLIIGAVVVAIIVLSCVGCLALGMIGSSSPTYKATATARTIAKVTEAARPTEAPKPTDTPSPTDTPIPIDTPAPTPTATPKPTPVPPTDTPEPAPEGPPLEVAAYMLEIMPKIQAISDSLTSLGELLTDPKFGDDSWTIAVATNIVVIRETHKELTEVEVPPEVAEIHAAVLDATGDCSESMDYLTTGIDNMSIEDLETAVSLMNSCSEKSGKAAEMMEEYTAQFE